MNTEYVKPLALVDNKTGHLMLLVDARMMGTEIESGMPCHLNEVEGRFALVGNTRGTELAIGPFSKSEAEKIRYAARLTIAAFQDGVVTRAREVALTEAAI